MPSSCISSSKGPGQIRLQPGACPGLGCDKPQQTKRCKLKPTVKGEREGRKEGNEVSFLLSQKTKLSFTAFEAIKLIM